MEREADSHQEDIRNSDTESLEKPLTGSLALPLSSTLLSVIAEFPEDKAVSAMEFASEILKRHPEYGGRRRPAP